MAGDDPGQETSAGQGLPDIYLVGAGIQIPANLTLEALDALANCQEIYTILSSSTTALLPRELSPKISSLWPLYESGALRRDAYAAEVETILEAAMQSSPVAYLTVGNPVFLDSVTQGILEAGQERGLDVRIVAGISSIDTVMADLQRDIAPGLQIHDATALVAFAVEPRVDIACLLLQPSVFGTAYVAVGYEPQPSTMAVLRDYLLQFYPPEHQVVYVTSAVQWNTAARLEYFALHTLGGTESAPQSPGASLFIPPARDAVPDPAFMARMTNAQNFAEAYRQSDTE